MSGELSRIVRCASQVIVLALILAGCQSAPGPAADTTRAAETRSGINDAFLEPDLDVEEWLGRFEVESREVFRHRHAMVEALRIQPGTDIADIGTGTGLFVPLLSKATGKGGLVYAVDIAPDFLAHVERRAEKAGLENVVTVLCTERSVELPPESIDLAFLCDTYHHFEFPGETMSSLHAALRPGGRLFVIDFKRIPGESSDWVLEHVRAGQEVVTREIEAAGFVQEAELALLEQNYFIGFRKP